MKRNTGVAMRAEARAAINLISSNRRSGRTGDASTSSLRPQVCSQRSVGSQANRSVDFTTAPRVRTPSLLAIACAAMGCVSPTVQLTADYQRAGFNLPVGVAEGMALRVVVLDDRADPKFLGISEDTYHQRIELDRPFAEILDDAFRALLSQAGFLLDEEATVVYQVRVRRVSAVFAHAFGAKSRANVSLAVNIISDGKNLGGVVVEGSRWSDQFLVEEGAALALSAALSDAVEKAVADPQLMSLATARSRSAPAQ